MSGMSRHFTDAELDIARSTDLPDLLTALGYKVQLCIREVPGYTGHQYPVRDRVGMTGLP